ncbi:acetolactate decarboxylase [Spiroplasma sp. DGKH1]|uniref:acetolactate decarboxylase n=1 Tax=Spiroplasma sp. DGKH1 TaxID=3050074 RepID=UPI0034C5EBD3
MKKNYSQLYQYSTIASLFAGNYDGSITFKELLKHGDFGLGTFDHLDGELIVLDGKAYQLKADGSVHNVKPDWTSPFASLSFFKADKTFTLEKTVTLEELEAIISEHFPSKNIFYALKITGYFEEISTRTVAYQEKPYPTLINATKDQGVAKFEKLQGTLGGFWTPEFANTIGVHNYHLHFLDDSKTKGGHVFNFQLVNPTVEISYLTTTLLVLPNNEEYLTADLENENLQAEIHASERHRG